MFGKADGIMARQSCEPRLYRRWTRLARCAWGPDAIRGDQGFWIRVQSVRQSGRLQFVRRKGRARTDCPWSAELQLCALPAPGLSHGAEAPRLRPPRGKQVRRRRPRVHAGLCPVCGHDLQERDKPPGL